MSDVTNLRQSEAKVTVEGKVSEIALERSKDDNGVEQITGSITIKTSDTNFVKFGVNTKKLTKDGRENKVFQGIETVMNEYKSIAKDGDEEADIVHVSGDINPFVSKNTGQTIVGYKSNFFNRITREPDPKAEFSVELFVKSVVPETANGEETGRAKIIGWMPTYNGIEPLELIVEEDNADDALSYFEPGNTYQFWGDIVANQIREERTIEGGFGKAKKEVKVSFKNELLCTGGSDPYDEDDEKKPAYDQDAIRLAIQQREDRLKNQNNTATQTKTDKKPSGIAKGRTLSF